MTATGSSGILVFTRPISESVYGSAPPHPRKMRAKHPSLVDFPCPRRSHNRYDVAAALVACPPADIEPDDLVLPVSRDHDGENNTSDAEGSSPSVEGRVQYLAGASGGDGERSGRDTPNSDLLEALSR